MSAGSVLNVEETLAGSELAADAAASATSITVEDPTDFQPDGGELTIGAEEKGYSAVDDATGVITLDSGLASSYVAGDAVLVLPTSTERFAHVQLEGQDETLQARVPHDLYPLLAVGLRDPNADEVELVEVDRDPAGELFVDDVLERVPVVDGSVIDPDTLPPPATSDGSPPATSPTPSVLGGVLSLFVQWTAIANADPVFYEVHVSTSSGFTPSPATFAGRSAGTLFVVRTLPGTTNPPAYGTTYFVKLVATDEDGAAGASAEDSGTPADGMDNAIIASLIAANAVIAEKLEVVLALATTLLAGTEGAGRVELGISTDDSLGGLLGIAAFAPDGTTLTFLVDSEDGSVILKGDVYFGTGSRLTPTDIIEVKQQSEAAFATPLRIQSNGGQSTSSSSVSVKWPAPTTIGSLLLLLVLSMNDTAGAPAITTPSDWTLVETTALNELRISLFKIEDAATRVGSQVVASGSGSVTAMVAQVFEYDGAEIADVDTSNAGTSTAPSTGTTATTTQAAALAIAAIGTVSDVNQTSPTNGFSAVRTTDSFADFIRLGSYQKVLAATGTQSMAATLSGGGTDWVALVATFKAKAVASVPAGPADVVRVYAKDVAGEPYLHVTDDAGVASALVLGTEDEIWKVDYVTSTVNPPSLAANSAQTIIVGITGIKVGDICYWIGCDAIADTPRALFYCRPPVCSVDGQINLNHYNPLASTVDVASGTHHFKVIHRS